MLLLLSLLLLLLLLLLLYEQNNNNNKHLQIIPNDDPTDHLESQNFILSLNSMTLKLKKEDAKHFFTKRFRLSRKALDEFC